MHAVWALLASLAAAAASRLARINSLRKQNVVEHEPEYIKNYVGLGYDAVFGNPFGSYGTNNDSGYRNAIVLAVPGPVRKGEDSKAGKGVWTRAISTCWHSDKKEGMGDDDDIMRELQNEFQIEGAETNELLEQNLRSSLIGDESTVRNAHYRLTSSFCAVQESGIVLPFKGQLAPAFVKDASNLPAKITGLDTCTADVYLSEPLKTDCNDVHKWIIFFRRYGTHITSHTVTGGQIIYIDRKVDAASKMATNDRRAENYGSTSVKQRFTRDTQGSKESRQMWIIGGFYVKGLEKNRLKSFKTWSQNVSMRPMPIRGTFANLDRFLEDKIQAYHQALDFYRDIQKVANGHSLNYRNFMQMIKETITVASPYGVAYCPQDMVVVSGFVMSKNEPYKIDPCVPLRSFCSKDASRGDGIVMIICGKGIDFGVTTVVAETTGRCPDDLVIAAGFQLYRGMAGALQIEACPSGEKQCGGPPGLKSVEWMICVRRNALDTGIYAQTGGTPGMSSAPTKCPASKKVISGFLVLNISHSLEIQLCPPRLGSCHIGCVRALCEEGAAFILCA